MDKELTGVTGADREEDLADVDTGHDTVGLAEGTAHTGLQSIGTSAGQHFVDTHDVVRVGTDTQVEGVLAARLDHVPANSCPSVCCPLFSNHRLSGVYALVGANTGSLEGFRA